MRFHSIAAAILITGFSLSAVEARDCGGELVRVSDRQPVLFTDMHKDISQAGMIAVGERHGLKEHVEAAACLLETMNDASPKGSVSLVVEHIASRMQPEIDRYRKDHPADATGLGAALQWDKSGWPAWPIYQPLYETAFKGGNPVLGAAQERGTPPPSQDALDTKLDSDNAARIVKTWAAIMNDAHCGTLDEARSVVYARVQAGRDIAMAAVGETVLKSGHKLMFYSGREHSRNDISVPHIVSRDTGAGTVSISLQETAVGETPADRKAILEKADGRFDYVWFIGKAPDEDVCAVFKNRKKDGQ